MTNVLIIMSDARLQTVYASEPDVQTFVLNYDVDGRNLSPLEQQCIMIGFPHDAAPLHWDLLAPTSTQNPKTTQLIETLHQQPWLQCQPSV